MSCESFEGSESSHIDCLKWSRLCVTGEKAGPCSKMNKSVHVLLTSTHSLVTCSIRALWSGRYKASFASDLLSLQYITLLKFRYACSKIFSFCSPLWMEKFKIFGFIKVNLIYNKCYLLQEISVSSLAMLSWEFLLLTNVCSLLWRWKH